MKVRKATIEDIERIKELNTKLFAQDFLFDNSLDVNWPSTEKGQGYFEKSITSENSLTLVGEEEGIVVGYMIVAKEKTPTYMKQTIRMVELENTFIEEDYRRRGLGARMYKELEKWAKEKGANMIVVEANAQNEKAHNFYRKMGLIETDITFQKEL